MQLEIIYTFDKGQKARTLPFAPILLEDRKQFFEYATSLLTGEEKETLVKMSCCLYFDIGLQLDKTHWYDARNGKFWHNEIVELMKEIWAINSIVPVIN